MLLENYKFKKRNQNNLVISYWFILYLMEVQFYIIEINVYLSHKAFLWECKLNAAYNVEHNALPLATSSHQ